ncbi:MAG TPA: hypothetical protein VH458_07290 [Vicinamibacterales bacterium]|jgi:hypothetical protein
MTARAALLALAICATASTSVAAAERYALIVSGANGDESYAEQYGRWRQALTTALRETFGFDDAHIIVLFDGADEAHVATADVVRHEVQALAARMQPDDILLLMMIGHGTFDGTEAKFNLVGPDMDTRDWSALLKSIPGRLVVVDSTSASFPFIERLAARKRIVITATDSAAQRFDTVFPEYFIKALTDPGADLDKDGRVSVWEAFIAASGGVRRYYEQRGQLATERALLDDNGDGEGREAGADGDDGSGASRLYLAADIPGAPLPDEELLALLQKRAGLESDADELKQRRALMTPDDYQKEFERLMIELARVSREIRRKQKT